MSDIRYEIELKKAIASLYDVFEPYRLNSEIAGCPCCVTDDDQKLIRSKILGQLTADDLDHYAFNAICTWGTIDDFKHFLPRLLELIAFNSKFFWSDTVIRKLSYAEFQHWAKEEQKAIELYSTSLWNYLLSQPIKLSLTPHDFLESSLEVKDRLELFLEMWQNHSSVCSLIHLSEFVRNSINFNDVPITIDRFSLKHTKIFLQWLSQDEIIDKLEQYFFAHIDEPYAEALATTVDILQYAFNK